MCTSLSLPRRLAEHVLDLQAQWQTDFLGLL